jgi:hypothetical protein
MQNLDLFLGVVCIVMSPVWFFFSVWDYETRRNGAIYLLLFGVMALWSYREGVILKEIIKYVSKKKR